MKTRRTKLEKQTGRDPAVSGTAHRRLRKTAAILPLLLIPCLAGSAATTRYVWQESPSPGAPFATWATAAHAIQDAVDAAVDGDTVLVSGGTYATGGRAVVGLMTNRVAIDKAIRVESLMGPEVTLIVGAPNPGGTNGDGAIRCVYLGAGAVLNGFTLTNGHTLFADLVNDQWVRGGGAWCEPSGVLTNCLITSNSARDDGAGVHGGTLYHCALVNNHGSERRSDGGAADHSTLFNCILTGNSARRGGAADDCTLYNCVLTGNKALECGGGAARSVLHNCTLIDNSARRGGGAAGVRDEPCYLYNCIVYSNQAPVDCNYDALTTVFLYSCTTPLPLGTGNIEMDPVLASLTHLSSASPCIGAGSALYASGVDIDGEPWGNPPCMGADQLTPGAATGPLSVALEADFTHVAVGFTASFKMRVEGQTTGNRWDFGDGTLLTNRLEAVHAWQGPGTYPVQLTVFNDAHPDGVTATVNMEVVAVPVFHVNPANPSPAFPYMSWATAATNIQDAIGAGAVAGRVVLVTNGVYDTGGVAVFGQMTNRIALTNGVTVRSVNGPEVTILRGAPGVWGTNGDGAIRCAYVGAGSVLDGFTLTNGHTRTTGHISREQGGGGAWCARMGVATHCVFIGNEAFQDGGGANGGIFYACTFSGNRAWDDSGGADDAVLYNCVLTGNTAEVYGGGTSESTLYNCILYYNFGGNSSVSTLYYCCTTPLPTVGTGNFTNEPAFVDYTGGNLRLRSHSPCINAGDNAYAIGDTDLDGHPRIIDGTVDLGAYEFGAPVIIAQPAGQTGGPGESVTFSLIAEGYEPFNFQWWKDGIPLAQGTGAVLTLTNLQGSDAGYYSVVVTNSFGSVTSAVALLTLNLASVDAGFDTGADSSVFSLAVQADGKKLVGGGFATLGGQPRRSIARLGDDGTLDGGFNPGADGMVFSSAVQPDGKILVGGLFTTLSGQPRTNIARLHPDGTLDLGFNPRVVEDGWVNALTMQTDGKILVGGNFTMLGGQPRNCIGRLNADGTLDNGFNPGVIGSFPSVYSLAVQPDGRILVGGWFTMLGGQPRTNIGRLNADGTLDLGFVPGSEEAFIGLVLQPDGKILVGGETAIRRLNPDGSLDLSFHEVAAEGGDDAVMVLALQTDGKILAGGEFTTLAGQPRNHIGRLNADGTLDLTFNPEATGEGYTAVHSLVLQPNGKVLVGGKFTTLGGQPRTNLARLNNTEPATESYSYDASSVTWLRGGTSPEVWRTTLDYSMDAVTWASLGAGTRIPDGWQWTEVAVPTNALLRARGFVAGSGISEWFVESLLPTFPQTAPAIVTDDGSLGVSSNRFGFNISGVHGQVVVIEGSSNLMNWTSLDTNVLSNGPFYFSDPTWSGLPTRYYRVRLWP